MIIQHNIKSLNAKKNLSINNLSMHKNLEKLSSGYRINRAGDDAAGLAISEKMRAQITGLDQAYNNTLDGISLVQTAEGAMEEIHNILNRLMGLSVQSANGTYSKENRQSMQEEVDLLLKEITRIEKTTNFNGLPILQGDQGIVITPPVATIKGGLPSWVDMPQKDDKYLSGDFVTTETYIMADGSTQDYQITHCAAFIDFSNLNASNVGDLSKANTGFYSTCCTCDSHYSIKFTTGVSDTHEVSGNHHIYSVGIDGITDAETLIKKIIAATDNGYPNQHYTKLAADPNNSKVLIIYDDRAKNGTFPSVTGGNWSNNWQNPSSASPDLNSGSGVFGDGVAYKFAGNIVKFDNIILQIGETSDASNQLTIHLPDMRISKIGISGISVSSSQAARASIDRVRSAIDHVSQERGRMGAYQNRLEHITNNLTVMTENISASESRIRDVDMAKEMMAYIKNNILSQSSHAMLSQANQSPKGVLQLLT